MKRAAIRAVLAAAVLAVMSLAAPAAAEGPGEARGPISISSDRLETDDAAGVVQFIGAVVARQGGLTLTSDRMKVFYTPGNEEEADSSPLAGGGREIDRVEAFGRVRMVDGDNLAVGDHALYLTQNIPRRLVLTGNARVWQGRDSLTGHTITYFLDERRSVAESAPRQRVRTVIHGGEAAPK